MHCIQTINLERDFGSIRFYLLASIIFFVVFCLSYIMTSYRYDSLHTADYLWLFMLCVPILYPLHKILHIVIFIIYRKPIRYKVKTNFFILPVLHARLLEIVSKRAYCIALLLPFITLNSLLLLGGFVFPAYSHYFCLLLALHCSICLLDLLFLKQIIAAPKNAFIEETPKGYEILVPEA